MTRLGVLLTPSGRRAPNAARSMQATAERARDVGWSVHIPEHRSRPDYVPSALAAAMSLGSSVLGLDVATAGVIVGRRDPHALLDEAATIHRMIAASGGKLRLGVVAGHDSDDFPADKFDDRFRRLDEFLALAVEERPCPVLVGGSGPVALRRARLVDGWLAPTLLGLNELTARVGRLRAEAPATWITVVRRWRGSLVGRPSSRVRTPDHAVWDERTALGRLEALRRLGIDEVVVGPIRCIDELDGLRAVIG